MADVPAAGEEIPQSQLQPADPANVRRAATAGLVGTMLENYDFVIYGTASALVFGKLFFPEISPVAGLIAAFSAYAVGFAARPLGGLFFAHFGERYGRRWVLVTTLFLMGGATFAIGCLPDFHTIGILAPVLLVTCRFLQGFGAGAEQSGGATLLAETAPLGRRGRLSAFVMVGAALGAVLGALAWVLVQQLPEEALMSWGWRAVFWSSIAVTIAAAVIRAKMAESPIFEELKKSVDVKNQAPLKEVARHGKRGVLRVILMNWGVSTQSYTYQVFMIGYLATVIGVDTSFIPPVQLAASVCAAIAAFLTGALSDRFGRRRTTLVLCGILVVTPFLVFPGLGTGSQVLIAIIIILGYMVAAQGVTGVHMSYFPELFGSRYRYAGVTLGREFSSVIGGGVAPLLAASLLARFADSWVPIAVYMSLTMLVSFIATALAPETVDRDLTVGSDAVAGEARPGASVGRR
ncbi:MFS transporter [Arenivirga flava]|uniref:MFS transporter n=1 Tax=Arenivirga flava TaxID=1930060 RepID=A0AA37UL95_9MICO|nr:MFS transporter [Arenivirga flava]GMA28557.1 MFS transporter [Arenivirga flava]